MNEVMYFVALTMLLICVWFSAEKGWRGVAILGGAYLAGVLVGIGL